LEDAKSFRDIGFNMIRLRVNYLHFEDDLNPRVFKYEGLKHLDRVIDIVGFSKVRHLSLHSVPDMEYT
jgi:aryl-phospho-beta-D-glucosidase BglC (GH1 family)